MASEAVWTIEEISISCHFDHRSESTHITLAGAEATNPMKLRPGGLCDSLFQRNLRALKTEPNSLKWWFVFVAAFPP